MAEHFSLGSSHPSIFALGESQNMLPIGRGRGRGRGVGLVGSSSVSSSQISTPTSSSSPPPGGLLPARGTPVISPSAAADADILRSAGASTTEVPSVGRSMAPPSSHPTVVLPATAGPSFSSSQTSSPIAQAAAIRQRVEAMRIEAEMKKSAEVSSPVSTSCFVDRSASPASSASGGGASSRSTSTGPTPVSFTSQFKGRRFQRAPPQPRLPPALPPKLPARPGFGTAGDQIKLVTNHFEIKMPCQVRFYHYDLKIVQCVNGQSFEWTGGRVPKHTRDEMRERCYAVYATWARAFLGEEFFALVYDRQQHLYSTVFIGKERVDENVEFGGDKYKVILTTNAEAPWIEVSAAELKKVAFEESVTLDRSPMQILDLLHNQMMFFKKWLNKTGYTPHGRCFYNDDQATMTQMPMGRMLKDGFVKSLRNVNGPSKDPNNPSLMVTMNIDAKNSPFHISQRLDLTASQILGLTAADLTPEGLKRHHIDQLKTHFRDLRCRTTYSNRIFTIFDVSTMPASKETFQRDGQKVTVAVHFQETWGALQFPSLPCVKDDRQNLFPMEKCVIVENQKVDLQKLTADQSSIIIKKSAVAPQIRRQKIMEKSNELAGQNDDFIEKLGLHRSKEMMKVEGRILKAPLISYANRKTVNVRAGSWQAGACKLVKPATIRNFAIICFERKMPTDVIQGFSDGLVRQARQMGLQIPDRCIVGDYKNVDELLSTLDEYKRQFDINLAICILGDKAPNAAKNRNDIKYSEKEVEVVTQCLATKTLQKYKNRPDNLLLENIVLKINVKCGGLNNEVSTAGDPVATKWLTNETMFVGLDVNHPPPLSKKEIAMGFLPKKPSVVGAVANAGEGVHSYCMDSKTQDARQEEISESNMDAIFNRFLTAFTKNKGAPPKCVVVYRDGVSESQFEMVLNKETLAIKNACAKFGCLAKLTVLTVQKRHNTRLFKEIPSGAKNADQNIPAGTVVDTGPVSPYNFDFFLASHSGIQGTTKASNYVIIHDDNAFGADELHRLTFLLCHAYQRTTKSVSLPAPCYFAHHAATRGKELTEGFLSISDEASSGVSSQSVGSGSTGSSSRFVLDYDEINKHISYSLDFGGSMIFL